MPDAVANPAAMPSAVVLGLSPTGLYVARELGKAGLPLLGVDAGNGAAGSSRFFRAHGTWRIDGMQGLLERLLAHASACGHRPFLVATSDIFIEWMIGNAEALRAGFVFPVGYEAVAPELLDKLRFSSLCARHGVEAPGIWEAADAGALAVLADGLPFPCILKPVLIHRAKAFLKGHKVLVARDRGEFLRYVDSIPADSGAWFVQEIIPGAESAITLFAGYVDAAGEVRQGFTARKLRQYPAGFGSASLVISEHCAETLAICQRFLPAIGYRGVFGAEFKRSPRDGRLKIIEINPRPTLWFHLSHASGKRVVQAAAHEALGLPAVAEQAQANGVLWRYALKDLVSAGFYAFKGGQFLFPAPDLRAGGAVTARCWPVFDAADPMPALMEPVHYVRKALRRFG